MKDVKKIIEQLKLLPCFDNVDNKLIDVNKIAEGTSHQCFKVETASATYFAKYFETGRLTRKVEHNTTILAAKLMLAPQLFFHLNQWLISEYISHISKNQESKNLSLKTAELNIKEKIIKAAQLMAKCHRLQLTLPILDLNSVLATFAADNALSPQQSNVISRIIKQLPKIKIGQSLVVCHGDVNFSNIIFTESAYLIDFECACMAEREYDLAMMAAINLLDNEQQSDLLSTYEINSVTKLCHSKLVSYLPYCYLINGLWYLLKFSDEQQSGLSVLSQKQFAAFDELMGFNSKLTAEMR